MYLPHVHFQIKKRRPVFILLLLFIISSAALVSCKKDKLKSRYASSLQHNWNIKSMSARNTVIGSYQGPWSTTTPVGIYNEYKSDGNLTVTFPGFTYTQPYELMSDSIILRMHPATTSSSYAVPDTLFIRQINESLFISYSRKYFISPNYSTLNETLDTLIR